MNNPIQDQKYRFGFLIEQTLGHTTYCQNLTKSVAANSDIDPVWMPVSFELQDRWDRVPGIRGNWTVKGSLRARTLLNQPCTPDIASNRTNGGSLDALLIHTQTIALFSQSWMRRVPTIVSLDATPRNIDSLAAGYGHRFAAPLLEFAKHSCTSRVFKHASALICWSKWAADSLAADYGVLQSKVTVIPPGVDINYWKPDAGARFWNGERPVRLLFVGGDWIRKGGPNLMQAFEEDLHNGFSLDIVTRSDVTVPERLSRSITVHHNISANSDAIRSLYHSADIFVLPTLADCLPLALLEAMAAGLPCVMTSVGAIPEAVTANVNGMLVKSNAPAGIAAAVRDVASSPERLATLSAESLRIAAERYDADRNHGMILAMMTMLSLCAHHS